jgi:hypothetical protein
VSHSNTAFARAIDSQFERLGENAIYIDTTGQRHSVRVIARLPEQFFELGEQSLHAENVQLSLRVNEVATPVLGDQICIGSTVYTINTEPRIDIHQLLWTVDLEC